MMGVSSVMFFG